MTAFAMILTVAFQQLKKDDKDSGKRIPLKAPKTFDGSFSKFRRWWVSQRCTEVTIIASEKHHGIGR